MFLSVFVFGFFSFLSVSKAEAKTKSTTTYRSAKTGRYTTKSYANSHKSTTYGSKRK